ncbi:hypothetical protein DJ481_18160 [Enterobacter hormaechei]|nr:hypothetical protein DJ481_18160 [Enterobacter hormaechei]
MDIENQQEELRTDDVVEQIEEEVKESTESDEHVEVQESSEAVEETKTVEVQDSTEIVEVEAQERAALNKGESDEIRIRELTAIAELFKVDGSEAIKSGVTVEQFESPRII